MNGQTILITRASSGIGKTAALQLAALPTRLKAYSPREACGLVNWGYIATDDQLRAKGPVSGRCDLPYPEFPV